MVIFSGLGLRERDEVRGCLGLHRRIDEKEHRSGADQTDRREVADRIVMHALLDCRNDGVRHVGEQQGVAVRRGFGGDLDAEAAAGAGTVVDDDLLAERFRQRLAEQACEHIRAAAGRVGHDQGDGMIGIGLGGQCLPWRIGRTQQDAGKGDEGGENRLCRHGIPSCKSAVSAQLFILDGQRRWPSLDTVRISHGADAVTPAFQPTAPIS